MIGEDVSSSMNGHADAAAVAAAVAPAAPDKLPVPELDKNVDKAKLLAILNELRSSVGNRKTIQRDLFMECVGTGAVDDAVTKIMNAPDDGSSGHVRSNKRPKKNQKKALRTKRDFQMDRFMHRLVAVKFLYLGAKYDGLARQGHTEETIERYIFRALVHTKLIKDIESCEYSRCGRTDKGVSAFGQVIGLRVRSNVPFGAELLDGVASVDELRCGQPFRVKMPNGDIRSNNEIDYAVAINRALPEDIRVHSVIPAPEGFSARFHCHERMYRYFFLRKNLDIEKMRLAATRLVGTHDFRNFCRIDTNNHTFERMIRSFEILQCEDHEATEPAQQMFRFEIFGRAFLWHQVRCMTQILFYIGEGKEEPGLVDTLLDIEHMPRKPQYEMAGDAPLCLQDCLFKDIEFKYTPLALYHVYDSVSALWEQSAIKTAMLRSHLDKIECFTVDPRLVISELDHFAPKLEQLMRERGMLDEPGRMVPWKSVRPLLPLAATKGKHIPLLSRNTGHSVQEARDQMKERKRRRLELNQQDKLQHEPSKEHEQGLTTAEDTVHRVA